MILKFLNDDRSKGRCQGGHEFPQKCRSFPGAMIAKIEPALLPLHRSLRPFLTSIPEIEPGNGLIYLRNVRQSSQKLFDRFAIGRFKTQSVFDSHRPASSLGFRASVALS